ncbi:MAG: ankyrin repeat domain-containing protein [Anaerolineae bacterium]|jgi:ankyrin repeat protein|nr:ankyrin repeat domain-containing protein [Anaerolineae bacterium]
MDYPSPIFQAVIEGNLPEVERLLKLSSNLANIRDRDNQSPLHHATTPEIAQLLIRFGAEVNARGWMGGTPLHQMAARNHYEAARVLIAKGANVNILRDADISPLNWAKSIQMARLLLENGANVSHQDRHGQSPFFNAVTSGDLDFVNLFIQHGVETNIVDYHGKTALHVATNAAILKRLLELGLPVNSVSRTGDTPLHNAVFRDSLKMVELLLNYGADVTIQNRDGLNPVRLAKHKGHRQVLDKLERHIKTHGITLYEIPQRLSSKGMIVNPRRSEAITVVDHAILVRWELSNPPKPIRTLYTEHPRLGVLDPSADGGQFLIWAVGDDSASCFLELRAWDTLDLVKRIPAPLDGEVQSAAFSPDGKWLALTMSDLETVNVVNLATWEILGKVDAGEWTAAVRFSPSSQLLATACSFQGGGHVGIHKITNNKIEDIYTFDRSNYTTPGNRFVDSLIDIAFSPDSWQLVLFETSRIYHELYPNGWRGNLAMYDLTTGKERWHNLIDSTVTGDTYTLVQAGYESGFFTQVIFIDKDTIACGSTAGNILLYDRPSGKLLERVEVGSKAAVIGLAADVSGTALWVLLDDGEILAVNWPVESVSP